MQSMQELHGWRWLREMLYDGDDEAENVTSGRMSQKYRSSFFCLCFFFYYDFCCVTISDHTHTHSPHTAANEEVWSSLFQFSLANHVEQLDSLYLDGKLRIRWSSAIVLLSIAWASLCSDEFKPIVLAQYICLSESSIRNEYNGGGVCVLLYTWQKPRFNAAGLWCCSSIPADRASLYLADLAIEKCHPHGLCRGGLAQFTSTQGVRNHGRW